MRAFLFATAALALCTGCKRGASTTTAPAPPESAKRAPAPPAANTAANKDKLDDAPNWLKDDRFNKDKRDDLPAQGGPGGKPKLGINIAPPQGESLPPAGGPQNLVPAPGAQNPPVQPNPAPAIPVPAVAPNGNGPLGAAARLVGLKDMQDLQIFIDAASLAGGKMPSAADVYAALVEARSPAAKLVKDGAIILTGTKERESVWAFEARAYLNGGWAVSQNGIETLTAAEIKKRLGK